MRDLLAEWAPSGTPGSLRLAVRNGYLNFYHLGQSVSKVELHSKRKRADLPQDRRRRRTRRYREDARVGRVDDAGFVDCQSRLPRQP